MKVLFFLSFLLHFTQLCTGQQSREKLQYRAIGRCDGCEGIFEYGNRKLQPVDTLPDYEQNEPKLKLSGVVYQADGKTPASDVILFIYQTNQAGRYPKKGNETGWAKKQGYIRGWAKTDKDGIYTFYTFMPGSYGSGAAHIHVGVLEPEGKYYFIEDYNFEGDPNLNNGYKSKNRGGSGLVRLQKKGDLLIGERNIFLGLNIPDYE